MPLKLNATASAIDTAIQIIYGSGRNGRYYENS